MKTRILITIGDINGIGPEIILKVLKSKSLTAKYDLTIISPFSVLEFYAKILKMKLNSDNFNIISIGNEDIKIQPGKITKISGYISGLAIQTAIELCLCKKYDAIVTAPISKKALNLGGFKFDGHTEMLTELSRAKETAMIMIHEKIKVGFATTHPPLKKVSMLLTGKTIYNKIKVCYNSLRYDFAMSNPSIGVLSLNPHAGENGQIGDEEIKTINPVIKKLQKNLGRLEISGPYPSDSYFGNQTYRKFALTFALYHDQGFIPFKMISGNFGVNFTAGLNFIRTSPDHGTAFDIAGKNLASKTSLVESIKAADMIFKSRNRKTN